MKIRKLIITALMGVLFSFAAFQTTAFAAENDKDAFTPGGSGTVIDNVMEKNGKEFYTIKTENGNIFYLIVDRLRDNDNVYFLNGVTESDLMALAEKVGTPIIPGVIDGENAGGGTPGEQQQPGQENPPAQNPGLDSNTTTMIFVGIAVAAVGGLGFYFKIVKGKKRKKDEYDDFDEYEDDGDDDYGGYDADDDPGDDDSNSNEKQADNDDDLEW